tara:strand:+ start:83 stop:187 length:105 start_codon:yes stop_codon:yes gene_type:complete
MQIMGTYIGSNAFSGQWMSIKELHPAANRGIYEI